MIRTPPLTDECVRGLFPFELDPYYSSTYVRGICQRLLLPYIHAVLVVSEKNFNDRRTKSHNKTHRRKERYSTAQSTCTV